MKVYELLLKFYPASYRQAYGDDLLATARELRGGRFSLREAASLASNGLRQRVIASTQASPRQTWMLALRTAIWFSLLNWLTFRLLNSWLVIRDPGLLAGRSRVRIGDVDVLLTTFNERSDWILGGGRALFCVAAAFVVATAIALLRSSGPLAVALAAIAGFVPVLIVGTGLGDIVLYTTHVGIVAWCAVKTDRRRVLAAEPLLAFLAVSFVFASTVVHRSPSADTFEHVWGVANMVAMGFGWGLFTLAGFLLIAHDPRMLPISAAIYAIFGLQVVLPQLAGADAIARLSIPAIIGQAAFVAVVALIASRWGNSRVLRT